MDFFVNAIQRQSTVVHAESAVLDKHIRKQFIVFFTFLVNEEVFHASFIADVDKIHVDLLPYDTLIFVWSF